MMVRLLISETGHVLDNQETQHIPRKGDSITFDGFDTMYIVKAVVWEYPDTQSIPPTVRLLVSQATGKF